MAISNRNSDISSPFCEVGHEEGVTGSGAPAGFREELFVGEQRLPVEIPAAPGRDLGFGEEEPGGVGVSDIRASRNGRSGTGFVVRAADRRGECQFVTAPGVWTSNQRSIRSTASAQSPTPPASAHSTRAAKVAA